MRGYFFLGKKGQFKLSFGMIFSIILIILFLSFAFFGIKKFISLQDDIQMARFKKDLQDDVDRMWKSSQGSQKFEYRLPNKVRGICIQEDESEELYFLPREDFWGRGKKFSHVNMSGTLRGMQELCIENKEGRLSLVLEKDFGENLVSLVKND